MTQEQALRILKTGANVFVTGEPGAGKTHLVNEFVADLRARGVEPAVTASTGIAATHIGGMTIHSWSGIGIKTELSGDDVDTIFKNKRVASRLKKASVLIIDEISMLHADTVSAVDLVCRRVRKSYAPFGGLQLVCVGDFFQLPPVVRGGAPMAYAFDSPAWKQLNPVVCYLTEQYRQDDAEFLEILSAIRAGTVEDEQVRRLEEHIRTQGAPPLGATKLFSHNADVDRINLVELENLHGKTRTFEMNARGGDNYVQTLKRGCLSPENLALKVGAIVMFTKNNVHEGFVNGTLGVVEGFSQETGFPLVGLRDGRMLEAAPMEWAIEDQGVVRAAVAQVPLRLAWAITVHKSQGMSLDAAVMDLRSAFEFGQGYVALSRVRRFADLYLVGFNAQTLRVHPDILEHDVEFRRQSGEMNVFGQGA